MKKKIKNNIKHLIFKNFTEYLSKRKTKYCILTCAKNFPSKVETDIDLYLDFRDKNELVDLINKFCKKNSLKIINILQHEINSYYFCLSFINLQNEIEFIQFDICNNYIINNHKILKFDDEEIFDDRKYKNYNYKVLKKDLFISYILIKKIHKRQLNHFQLNYISKLFKRKKTKEIDLLKKIFSKQTYTQLIEVLKNKKNIFTKKKLIYLNNELIKSNYIKKVNLIDSYKLKLYRFLNPTGLFVVFLGCDGSGKSLMIRNTIKKFSFAHVFRKTKTFHWVPLKNFQNKKVNFKNPHLGKEYSLLVSLIKILYLNVIFLYGYCKNIFFLKKTSGLIINDRYFHDLLIDKKRYRIKSFQLLIKCSLKLLPNPDLLIVLDAPANILAKRKNELNKIELSKLRLKYINLKKIIKDTIIIKNTGKINKIEDKIFKLIHDKMYSITKKRYKI